MGTNQKQTGSSCLKSIRRILQFPDHLVCLLDAIAVTAGEFQELFSLEIPYEEKFRNYFILSSL